MAAFISLLLLSLGVQAQQSVDLPPVGYIPGAPWDSFTVVATRKDTLKGSGFPTGGFNYLFYGARIRPVTADSYHLKLYADQGPNGRHWLKTTLIDSIVGVNDTTITENLTIPAWIPRTRLRLESASASGDSAVVWIWFIPFYLRSGATEAVLE